MLVCKNLFQILIMVLVAIAKIVTVDFWVSMV